MSANAALLELIHQAGGSITFERFMDFALHDPTHGYYARRIAAIGTRGDFTTTAEISPALPQAIAAWATTALKNQRIRHLIEIGPGNGTLAAAVWKNLPTLTRWRTTLHLVDSSSPLREIQHRHPVLRRARQHPDLPTALAACAGNAIIYSNELLDAFPVRVLRQQADHTSQELHLTLDPTKKSLTETWLTTPDPLDLPTKPDQRIEIPAAAATWLKNWLPHWKNGIMLHIDYGHPADHTPLLPTHGTLRGYLHHTRLTGPELYQNIGRIDITADVNFTHLIHASSTHTDYHQLITQAEFLAPYIDPANPGDLHAAHPQGAGTAFLVWSATRKTSPQ